MNSTLAKRTNAEEQYQLILECRSSDLSDYQWRTEHGINPGIFYNWVKRLRKKACYDIPDFVGRSNHVAQHQQEVVPLFIVDNPEPKFVPMPKVEHNARTLANETHYTAELNCGDVSVRISNDINRELLFQILQYMGGLSC